MGERHWSSERNDFGATLMAHLPHRQGRVLVPVDVKDHQYVTRVQIQLVLAATKPSKASTVRQGASSEDAGRYTVQACRQFLLPPRRPCDPDPRAVGTGRQCRPGPPGPWCDAGFPAPAGNGGSGHSPREAAPSRKLSWRPAPRSSRSARRAQCRLELSVAGKTGLLEHSPCGGHGHARSLSANSVLYNFY